MEKLQDIARAIKSANAGASWITFDIMFSSEESYARVRDSGIINSSLFASVYGVPESQVEVYNCGPAWTIKVTMPRRTMFGGPDETDFDGVQQYVPLLNVAIP